MIVQIFLLSHINLTSLNSIQIYLSRLTGIVSLDKSLLTFRLVSRAFQVHDRSVTILSSLLPWILLLSMVQALYFCTSSSQNRIWSTPFDLLV